MSGSQKFKQKHLQLQVYTLLQLAWRKIPALPRKKEGTSAACIQDYTNIYVQHGLLIGPKVLKNFLETFLAADFPANSAAFSPTCCKRSVHDFVPMVSPSLSMTSYSASNSPAAPRWKVHLGHGWAPYNVGALKETTGLRLIQPIENVHVYRGLC